MEKINQDLNKNSIIRLQGGDAIVKAELRKFLSKNKIWKPFKANIQRQNINVSVLYVDDFCGFTWEKTPEGFSFWYEWHHKWKTNPTYVSNKGKKYVMKKKYRRKRRKYKTYTKKDNNEQNNSQK